MKIVLKICYGSPDEIKITFEEQPIPSEIKKTIETRGYPLIKYTVGESELVELDDDKLEEFYYDADDEDSDVYSKYKALYISRSGDREITILIKNPETKEEIYKDKIMLK